MKFAFILFFTLISVHSWGKFVSTIRFIPCNEVKIKVKSCKPKNYSNHTYTRSNQEKKRLKEIRFKGVLVTGEVISQKVSQCYPKHEIHKDKYRHITYPTKEETFFIQNGKCEKEVNAISLHTFCDTPNALSVKSCFIRILKQKEKLHFFKYKDF